MRTQFVPNRNESRDAQTKMWPIHTALSPHSTEFERSKVMFFVFSSRSLYFTRTHTHCRRHHHGTKTKSNAKQCKAKRGNKITSLTYARWNLSDYCSCFCLFSMAIEAIVFHCIFSLRSENGRKWTNIVKCTFDTVKCMEEHRRTEKRERESRKWKYTYKYSIQTTE